MPPTRRRQAIPGRRPAPASPSLYSSVSETLEILGHESRLERVHVAANLRHHEIEPLFNEQTRRRAWVTSLSSPPSSNSVATGLCLRRLFRGKPSAGQGLFDYNFDIFPISDPSGESDRVDPLKVGSPLDKLVAEADDRRQRHLGGLWRSTGGLHLPGRHRGKVRMTTSPCPTKGWGDPSTPEVFLAPRRYAGPAEPVAADHPAPGQGSPLRGQPRPLRRHATSISLTPPTPNSSATWSVTGACAGWAEQGVKEIDATVRKENLVKLDHLPLQRVPSLPELPMGKGSG